MSRNALLVGGLVVAAAIVALVLALKKDEARAQRAESATGSASTVPAASTGAGPTRTSGATGATEPGGSSVEVAAGPGASSGRGVPRAPGAPTVAGPDDPRAPVVTPSDQPRGTGEARSDQTYTVGGVHVRDHRGSDAPVVDVPPSAHAPGAERIAPSLTAAIGGKVRGVIAACAGELTEGRGAEPRIEGQFVISVRAAVATVTSAVFQPRDLSEAAAAQLKKCTETRSVGLTAPAPDQTDLDNYGINVTLRLP